MTLFQEIDAHEYDNNVMFQKDCKTLKKHIFVGRYKRTICSALDVK